MIFSKDIIYKYVNFIKENLDIFNEPIYIIGLPGSGKTTLGKILSDILKFNFVDLDEYIEDSSKMSIADIFKIGEYKFREIEKNALFFNSKNYDTIISTGGGVVTTAENRVLLKNSKFVLYIDRSCKNILEDVSLRDRPLLRDNPNKIYELYEDRKDFYEESSNMKVLNDSTINFLVERSIEIIYKKISDEVR